MKVIDTGYDEILNSNFELCSTTYGELKKLARSWYGDIDFERFDDRSKDYMDNSRHSQYAQMKISGLASNYFFVSRESNGEYYLLDGFNRLFTDYGPIEYDNHPVYIKVLTDNLEDWHYMQVLFRLNMWKVRERYGNFHVQDYFDRGVRLFMYKKFGIEFYSHKIHDSEGEPRKRDKEDLWRLDKYFRKEWLESASYIWGFKALSLLLSNKKIIHDIREILKINDFKEKPFNNFDTFFEVYIVFLSARRIYDERDGVVNDYPFEKYLNGLKEDKKFFKKFTGMSWTDSTRKNAYKWIREFHENNNL